MIAIAPRAARPSHPPARPPGRPRLRAAFFALALGLAALPCAVHCVHAATLEVGREGRAYRTLVAALGAAKSGDVVLVDAGTYRERLELPSGVTLRSRSGPDVTILQGDSLRSILIVRNSDSTTAVEGFTFRGGGGSRVAGRRGVSGGGILCIDARLRIRGNVFRRNQIRSKGSLGGAVAVFGGSVLLEENRFIDNRAARGGAVYLHGRARVMENRFTGNHSARHGGALMAENSVALIERNIFDKNEGAWGGAACVGHLTEVTLRRNTFVKNKGRQWGGGVFLMDSEPVVESNLFVANEAYRGGGLAGGVFAWPTVRNNLGWKNWPGDFVWVEDTLDIPNSTRQLRRDPRLVGLERGDYHPLPNGPAASGREVIGALDPPLENFHPKR